MNIARSSRPVPVWLAVVVYAVMTVVVLYPILVVQVPGLGDYLNHLARMHILYDHPAGLSRFYQVVWQPIPYLSMEAAFAVLSRLAPIYDAGRIFLGICIVLPALSVTVLHYVVHRRLSLVPAAAFLFCQNYLLSWGFLVFLPSLCLAVMLFALWIATEAWPRPRRLGLFCVLALGLYFCHLVAFGAYCLEVGGFEIARAWRKGFRPWRTIAADWLTAGAQILPAIVVALSVTVDKPFVGPVKTEFGDLASKLSAIQSPVMMFGGRADGLTMAFAVLVLVAGLLTRRIRLAPAVWPAAAFVGAVAVCTPVWLLGTFGMDFRLPLLVAMLLVAGTSPTERMSRGLGCAVLSGFLALTLVRSIGNTAALREVDGQIAELRQLLDALPHGMRLLIVDTSVDRPSQRTLPSRATAQMGMVALIDWDAFVPFLFTGLSTVRPVPALLTSSTPNGSPLHLSDLMEGLGRQDAPGGDTGDGEGRRVYWMGWENKFDYVLIQHFGARPETLPANLHLVATSPVADLYRIDRAASP